MAAPPQQRHKPIPSRHAAPTNGHSTQVLNVAAGKMSSLYIVCATSLSLVCFSFHLYTYLELQQISNTICSAVGGFGRVK